jgi:ribosomal protein L37E
MKESLIICPRCGSNACHEASNEKFTMWSCFGCGFTSNSTMTDEHAPTAEETLPELYKALKFKDEKGYHWYPIALTFDDKSMVFAEGTSTTDWKWSAVKSKDGKADMTTKSEFEERDFMEALDYVGYFNQK